MSTFDSAVPAIRIDADDNRPPRGDGQFVLYWMTAARRTGWNFALQRGIEWATALGKPLLVVETLTMGGRWDSVRHHCFVLDGMIDNAAECQRHGVCYRACIEPKAGAAKRLLRQLARQSCVVVTDDHPISWIAPKLTGLGVRTERIDGNGLLPLRAASETFPTAYSFRRFLQQTLRDHLLDAPRAQPLAHAPLPQLEPLPEALRATLDARGLASVDLARLPLDRAVGAVAAQGGCRAARRSLGRFLGERLPHYSRRNHPAEDVCSRLSPYLRHGHLSVHEVFHRSMQQEHWSPDRLADKPNGRREGWWGVGATAEAFLDQLITWREVGYNFCHTRPSDFDAYESLPTWAQATLDEHTADPREHVYSLAEFDAGATHDPLWNAAQAQLRCEGTIHNYLRMLWGKKIVEWSASPRDALATMIDLNNKYALDGCDPNSYSGIFWVLGRYDRPWGPRRPVLGTVRYMSSANTARKVKVGSYIGRHLASRPAPRVEDCVG
jgi:deoxyribodipyrimidine photo-lyase